MSQAWDRMLGVLADYRDREGHANVPVHCADNPSLGRWVAAQRHRRRTGELDEEQIARLDALGFVWSPGDVAWESMLRELEAFVARHGHCRVPEHWPENQKLANWVQSQRHRRKTRRLSKSRVERLDALGFAWAARKGEPQPVPAAAPATAPEAEKAEPAGERLYFLGNGVYVQYGGNGGPPRQLADYVAGHGGEFPPYIPLPQRGATFLLGEDLLQPRRIAWHGRGPLPEAVMDHVCRNGILPRHE